MFDYDSTLGLEWVKGMAGKYGSPVSVDAMLEASERANEAFKTVMDRVKKATNPQSDTYGQSFAGDWRHVNPMIAQTLMGMAASQGMGKSLDVAQLTAQLQAMESGIAGGIQKDITTTSPLSSGLVPFDLVAPAKQIYPTYSPIRNKMPRVPGMGTSRKGKRITGIDGSNGVFSGGLFLSDLPAGVTTSLNFPPSLQGILADDKDFPYSYYGQGNNASLLAVLAGRGFQDIEALTTQILLQSMMLQEEGAMLFSRRSSALATPGTPTVTDHSPSATHVAFNSGGNKYVFVKISALSGLGETLASTTAGTVLITAGNNLLVSWTPVTGAAQYRVYVSSNSSNSDPGDAARWLYTTVGYATAVEVDGPILTSGTVAPVSNTTQQTLGFDGIFANISASGDYTQLGTGFTTGGSEIQKAFARVWNNVKGDPDEIWLSGSDRLQLSTKLIEDQSNTSAYRLTFDGDHGSLTGGAVVSSLWNMVTGKRVDLTVHPWIPQGNVVGMSYRLPFPYSDTPNVWEMVMVQDYLGLAFPQFDLVRRFAIVAYGGMACWAPAFNFMISDVVNSNLP